MRDARRKRIGLLLGVMALMGAIVVPGTAAQSETVRMEVGVLRLHLDSGANQRYFRFDTRAGDGYTQGIPQLINQSQSPCPVSSLSGPQWVSLTAGTTSFALNQVGLSNNSLGVRFLNCGRVDAPNWALRIKLGTDIDPLNPPASGIGVDRAELDLQGWGGVTAVADLFLDGAPTGSVTQFISGTGTRARMVIDRTGLSLFDEIRLHPRDSFDSVALRGGGAGSPPRSTMGLALGTDDSLFRVVSETTAPSLSVTKNAVVSTDGGANWPQGTFASGDDLIGFDIQVSNASGAGQATGVSLSDVVPPDAGLSWSIASQSSGTPCGPNGPISGMLSCNIGTLNAGSSFTVRITSAITSATVADSPVVNTANVTSTNGRLPPPAQASIEVFAGSIACGQTVTQTGGASDPVSELTLLDDPNDPNDCTQAIPITLKSGPGVARGCDEGSPQCILLQKPPDLVAQFFWTVEWAPETGDYMETETEFDFDFDGSFTPLQLCRADDADADVFPELPLNGDPWCVVDTSTELQIDTGFVIVTERYYGEGDPGGKR